MWITFGCELTVEVDQFCVQFNTLAFVRCVWCDIKINEGEAVSGGKLKPTAAN